MLDRRTDAVQLEVQRAAGGSGEGRCVITVADPELVGHEAELALELRVEVLDSRPVHAERELFRTRLRLDGPRVEVPVPESALCCYRYAGSKIRMAVHAVLTIDDGLLFDSKAEAEQALAIPDRPALREDAEELIEPDDAFDFAENFQAIPLRNRGVVSALLVVGLLVVGLNTLLGLHDQLSPEGQTYFYSHRDSDGDSQSPLVGSLVLSGGAGGLVWLAIRRQLRRYMRFEIRFPGPVRRGAVLPARELVHGLARCDLEDVTVRLVAANRERGQYKRGSGTKERTVSFVTPVRAVLLYERRLRRVPAGSPLESHLDGEIAFEPMFAALYPPLAAGSSHGLDVVWEVQLLHPLFVDQELPGDCEGLLYQEFLEA
jgi:hypothetical protein